MVTKLILVKVSGTVHLKSQCTLFILCKSYINKTYFKRQKRTGKEEIQISLFVGNTITYIENLHKFRAELLELENLQNLL